MQEQKNSYKYFYNGKEISKEQFGNLTEKWFDTNTANAVDYSSVSNFFDGGNINISLINDHVASVPGLSKKTVENYDNDKRLKAQQNDYLECLGWQLKRGKKIEYGNRFEGEKHNKGKLPMSKLVVQFPDALQAVVLASCYGHNKYKEVDVDWLNFKKVPGGSQAYKDACLRHSLGAEKDEESGLPEVFHQAWNKLAELQLWLEENNINIKKFSKEYLDNLK